MSLKFSNLRLYLNPPGANELKILINGPLVGESTIDQHKGTSDVVNVSMSSVYVSVW